MKKKYITPVVKSYMVAPMQVIAASPESFDIVDDENETYDPVNTFSIRQTWSADTDLENED